MISPMLNVRKPPGKRGEAMVSRMRARKMNRGALASRGVVPSNIFAGQTGTIARKRFSPVGRKQPMRAFPFLGGLPSVQFGE